MRDKIKDFIERPFFTNFIIGLILFNAVTLGMETSQSIMAQHGSTLLAIDRVILAIFTIEIGLKLFAYRLGFFKSGWNVFDLAIVLICLLPATGVFAILRAFRIFRVFRLISMVPQMRVVISGLFRAIPGMASVIGVIVVIFYISSVLATKIFGHTGDEQMTMLFGSLDQSMFTMFQLMTLENWVDGIVKPAMEVYPLAWLFFIPFIIITSFAILNLFIGVIVEAMQSVQRLEIAAQSMDEKEQEEATNKKILSELLILRQDIENIKNQIKK